MRAAEHAPRNPRPFLERRHGLVEIVERGAIVQVDRCVTLPGAFLIVLGQKTVFGDRKRGDYWMQTGKVNPDPIVYSYGELFFMTGWILFSLAMSIAV